MFPDRRPTYVLSGLATAAGCLALTTTACSSSEQSTTRFSKDTTRVVLAAARQHQLRMFGDFPDAPAPEYVSRTLMSLRQHTFTEVGGDFDVDVSARGERLVFASTRHHTQPDLYLKGVTGVAVTQLTSDPASDIQPAFSPDDSRVAFASNRGGDWDIWVVDAGGGPAIQITSGPADDLHPSWSPDGTQIVYCSLPPGGGQWELWIADAGQGSTRRFIGYGLFPEWSPKGDKIVFQRARERGSRWFSVWSLTLVDGEPRYPTELATSASRAMILPTFSPDGTRVAYVSVPLSAVDPVAAWDTHVPADRELPDLTGSIPYDIWIMEANGAAKIRLTDGQTMNHAPCIAGDGRVYFTCNRSGRENIWSLVPGGVPGAGAAEASVTRQVDDAKGYSRPGA